MKRIITYLSILVATVLFTPNTAEARTSSYGNKTYVSGHTSCGCPIHTKKIFVNKDRFGRPVYKYLRVASTCKCKKTSYRYNNHHVTTRAPYTVARGNNNTYYHKGSKARITYRR